MTPYVLQENIYIMPFTSAWWDTLLNNNCKPQLYKYKCHNTKSVYAHDLDVYICTGATDYFTRLSYRENCTCSEPKPSGILKKRIRKIKSLTVPNAVVTISLFTISSNLLTQLKVSKFNTLAPVRYLLLN